MSTKVEQASSHTRTNITSPSVAVSKTPIFAKKSGFVIPKNKLTGSLVPILRGKKGSSNTASEGSIKQVQRKTKWGPDLTQDTAVRKGRALAYQTRVDQITQQLGLRSSETGENQDLASVTFQTQEASSAHQLGSEESECLELERRELIGEILKLNPSYKAPADYKPLLKEAKVPIPIKEYPGYNFIGLIFGAANDTQKRLEKETGAEIRVYGTKVATGDKVEVTSEEPETNTSYEELHVHVSADTYEKVDAAVALIELLITPVSVNPASVSTSTIVSGDNVNFVVPSQGISAAGMSQGVVQPNIGSAQEAQPNDFHHYGGSWFPVVASQALPSQDFTVPSNPSEPISNLQFSSPLNPSMHSLFGPRPVGTPGAGLVPQNPSLVPSGQQGPLLSRPYMPQPPPRNPFIPASQPTPSHPSLSANRPMLTGPSLILRPGMSSLPHSDSPTIFSNQPMTSSQPAGWSQPLVGTPSASGPGNMMPLLQGHTPGSVGHPQSAPRMAGASANHPMNAPPFNATSHPQIGHPSPLLPSPGSVHTPSLVQSMQPRIPQGQMPASAPNLVPRPNHVSPIASNSRTQPTLSGIPGSGGALSINPIRPSFSVPSQQPSPGDFTFQPPRPQNPMIQVQRPGSQPMSNPSLQQPQVRPGMHNHPSPVMPGFSRPHVGNLMNQPRTQTPSGHPGPLRHGTFPNPAIVSPSAVSLIQPRNFNPVPPHIASAGLNPRTGGPTQNYPLPAGRPQGFVAPPNHQFNNNISFRPVGRAVSGSSRPHQVYDPFSPTASSHNHPQLNSNRVKMEKQENDAEYEDLMASVGVK